MAHGQSIETIFDLIGDLENDMREIKLYFRKFKGKKPENFTIGNV